MSLGFLKTSATNADNQMSVYLDDARRRVTFNRWAQIGRVTLEAAIR